MANISTYGVDMFLSKLSKKGKPIKQKYKASITYGTTIWKMKGRYMQMTQVGRQYSQPGVTKLFLKKFYGLWTTFGLRHILFFLFK